MDQYDGAEKSNFYERKAAELRDAAGMMRLASARLQLLTMAQSFLRVAERIKGKEQQQQAAD